MNVRLIMADLRQAVFWLLGLFVLFLVMGKLGNSHVLDGSLQDQTAVKIGIAVYWAIFWTVTCAAGAFLINRKRPDVVLMALPISRTSVFIHRYLGILLLLTCLIVLGGLIAWLIQQLYGLEVEKNPIDSFMGAAFLSLALFGLYNICCDAWHKSRVSVNAFFLMLFIMLATNSLTHAHFQTIQAGNPKIQGPEAVNFLPFYAASAFLVITVNFIQFHRKKTFV